MDRSRRLIDVVKEKIEFKKYSLKTAKSYRWWIKQYIIFFNNTHPLEIPKESIETFIKNLSDIKNSSSTTQNQAINALIFLYEDVLEIPLDNLHVQSLRAKRIDTPPTILTKDELKQLFYHLSGTYRLMALLMYGCGLRMGELLNLKIADLDVENQLLHVEGRDMPLPMKLFEDLEVHLSELKKIHISDLKDGRGTLEDCNEFDFQYLFPMKSVTLDKKINTMQREHIKDKTFARNIKSASKKALLEKSVSANTLRHSYAIHMLQSGVDIKTLQELLGHKDVSSTKIYQQILKESKETLKSPLD